MNYSLLGQGLRIERKKLSLTQEQLAEEVGVSDAYIGQIELGERTTLETLVKIASVLEQAAIIKAYAELFGRSSSILISWRSFFLAEFQMIVA